MHHPTLPPLPELPAANEWLRNTKEGWFSPRSATLKELDRSLLTYQQCHKTYTRRCQVYCQYFDQDWFGHVGPDFAQAAAAFHQAAEAFRGVLDSFAAWKRQGQHSRTAVHGAATALERALEGGMELTATGQELIRRGHEVLVNPFELKTGTVIPSILVNDLNSDPSVELSARVCQHIYDTASGRHLLIPQGTRIFGRYTSQDGALVAWQRLVYPLQPSGHDEKDHAGFARRMANYDGRIFGLGQLTSVLRAEQQFSQLSQNTPLAPPSDAPTAAAAVARQTTQLGTEMARHNVQGRPTVAIRKGHRLNVFVNDDIVFADRYRTWPTQL